MNYVYSARAGTTGTDDLYGMHGDAAIATTPAGTPVMPGSPEAKKVAQKKLLKVGAGALLIAAVSFYAGRKMKRRGK